MKPWCALVVWMFVCAGPAQTLAADSGGVRPLDEMAGRSLDQGGRQSASFRRLVEELLRSDLIVHIVTTQALPHGTDGTTRFVAAVDGHRYVRISIDPTLPEHERVAILGHELQHACELARSAARTTDAVRRLFMRIGHVVPAHGEAYETRDAADAGRQVFWEVQAAQRRERRAAMPQRR